MMTIVQLAITATERPEETTDDICKTDIIDRSSVSKTSFTACEGSNKHILGGIEK